MSGEWQNSECLGWGELGDTSLSRTGPATLAIGNGKDQDASGTLKVAAVITQGNIKLPTLLTGSADALGPGPGEYLINSSGVDAIVLAAPTATVDDGKVITIFSLTAHAHTVTSTGSVLLTGSSGKVHVITFPAVAGAGIALEAYQGNWILTNNQGCTLTS